VKRTEYQAPEELLRKETLDTFAGAHVTLNHPPGGFVTSDTWRKVAIGHASDNVRVDAGQVLLDLYVKDAAAVAAIKAGHIKHISLGYKVDFDPTPGTTPEGQRYDGVQRNIRVNHIALLPVGVMPRGGQECVLRLDAKGDEEYPGLKSGVDEQALKDKIAALESELAKVRTDAAALPKLTADLSAANARIAELGEQLRPERLDAASDARAAVVALAKAEGLETVGKSTLDLKRAVVAKRTPELANRVDSMNDAALDPVLVVYGAQPHPSLAAVLPVPPVAAAAEVRTDAAPVAVLKYADMYAKSVENSRNAWKNTGEKSVRS
jgi:hypothetical protein